MACTFVGNLLAAEQLRARVLAKGESRLLKVAVLEPGGKLAKGQVTDVKVSYADYAMGYVGREIRAEASHYDSSWHLKKVFPLDGPLAEQANQDNESLNKLANERLTLTTLGVGDSVPEFGAIDQRGNYRLISQLKGRPYMLNFIFTRCAAPTMCPQSTRKMAELQDSWREQKAGQLDIVTVTFDPEYDSPSIMAAYAQAYKIEEPNYHFMTWTNEQLVDDLRFLFGILAMKENGTINHTLTTLLVDADGKIAYLEEGPDWSVDQFIAEAKKLQK
ncbi:SCO family protein [Persicirhabdus sediminis]|uniref:SCO family protein n=1 Tax=Persicirhabdus sediminis TaxID=454144 RepID=A0A8J7SKY5_9BACT|nr:SCO family protein [Persicirhabdus sediminis]MBK1792026.1 SCO family protein [Persicirhabdus sediminis]